MENRPLIIAHRGYSAKYPPNTWEAIKKAFEFGADVCEIDVQFTKDCKAVVFHDYYLKGKRIIEYEYKELKEEGIIELKEVLEYASQTGKKFLVEIKDRRILQVAEEYFGKINPDLIIVSSFDGIFLKEFKKKFPRINTCILLGSVIDGFSSLSIASYVDSEYILPAWENRDPYPDSLITKDWLEFVLKHNKNVIIWHEEREEILKNLVKFPVYGICTNDVPLLRDVLKQFNLL